MSFEKFLFYGYNKEAYRDCLDLIKWTNRRHLRIINSWFLVVNALYVFFATQNLFGVNDTQIRFYSFFTIVSLVWEIFLFGFRTKTRQLTIPMVYLMMLMLLSYSVLSSLNQRYMAATMMQVLSVIVAVSFIDNILTIGSAVLIGAIVFLYTSYLQKPLVIAYQDIYNTIVFASLALICHYAFSRARMSQFVTYKENEQNRHDLAIQSSFDTLTELLGRGKFFELADRVIEDMQEDEYLALCLLDLDGFKQINDSYGHQMGDMAITAAGKVVLEGLDIVVDDAFSYPETVINEHLSFAGRLGGDEFICVIRGARTKEEVAALAEKILKNLNSTQVGQIDGLHSSFGITRITDEDRTIDGPYQRADDALYESKKAGKNQISFNNRYKRWREE